MTGLRYVLILDEFFVASEHIIHKDIYCLIVVFYWTVNQCSESDFMWLPKVTILFGRKFRNDKHEHIAIRRVISSPVRTVRSETIEL